MADRQWRCLKGGIKQALAATVPKIERKKKNEWMTDEILNTMNARRNIKVGSAERERLESKIRLECKRAKEKWYSDKCAEIENLEKRKNMRLMHEKVKELTDRRRNIRNGSGCIMSKDGELLFEKSAVKERWVQYIHDLYKDEKRGIRPDYVGDDGPSITQDEVSEAIKKMKDRKATGVDEIPTECLKALDTTSLKILTDLFNKIYKTGYIPNDLAQSIFITIPKKPKALECSDFRTISLMSHVMKALLKIILARNEKKVEAEISENQSGFRPGKGTREGIFNLRIIIQRYIEVQKPVYICFIDYEKAFDRVYHDRIMQCLDHIDMDCNDKRVIEKLYWQQTATVRFGDEYSEFFPIKRGVRQGCVLSPKLFNLYTEKIFNESDELPGCVVGGENLNNLRYADDTALLAESESALQDIVDVVRQNSEEKGLSMNVKKTKTMVVCRDETPDVRIVINGQVLEQVKKFKYLGQWITDDGRCECEIKNRIEIARSTFIKMRDVLISRKLHLEIRKRLVRCYVLSTFLYASESWTLDRQIEDKINAFEMWIFRRMFRISHLDRKTNLEVLEMAKAKQTLLRTIQERKLQYFGHLIRGKGKQKLLMEGKIEGTRRKGKQRRTWTSDVTGWCGSSYTKCVRMAENRKEWSSMTADLLIRRWHPQ
jgi:hypothetical protein